MNIPELLAPVGSREALTAAVQNGADAVYLGGTMFSARQYANIFDRDQMQEVVEYAHLRGVLVYVTVNTLLADHELPEAVDYLKFLYQTGVDAIIVQDLGVARVARELLPDLVLHASTQMTVHNTAGVETLRDSGFRRVVLARELSLREIAEIQRKTGVELEVFVHGALCVCYSGQCLMSSMIGGRSGNRGRCAQPCRMEYTLVDEKGKCLADPGQIGSHLLSPMDLNMIQHIPELAQSGVCSLKIEGRMKRPEYVATVTRIYREALDRYKASPEDYQTGEKDHKELAQIFNRGFTTGYFFGKSGRDMMSFKRPNNRGLRLGRVSRVERTNGTVEIHLEDDLNIGDGVEFWVTEGGRGGVIVNRIIQNGSQVENALAGQKVWIPAEGKIRVGDRVFKTHDTILMAAAGQSYTSPREIKKIPLGFIVTARIGEPFKIAVFDHDGHQFSAVSSFAGQEARNKPLTRELLQKQLDRLGNTPFLVETLEAEIDENVMIPASEINETRRAAIDGLAAMRVAARKPVVPVAGDFTEKAAKVLKGTGIKKTTRIKDTAVDKLILTVKTDNFNILKTAAQNGADVIYFGGSNLLQTDGISRELNDALIQCEKNRVKLVISTPRIIRNGEMPYIMPLLEFARDNRIGVLAANLGLLSVAAKMKLPEIYADFTLNIFNLQTLLLLREKFGISQAAVSPELTLGQITNLTYNGEIPLEAVVEGHLPLMVTEYCPQGSLLGGLTSSTKCRRPCKETPVVGLKDRLGLVFPVTQDEFCRAHIYNTKELSMIEDIMPLFQAGISRFRLETSIESPDRAARVIRYWRSEIDRFKARPGDYEPPAEIKEKIAAMSPAGLTKGHYYRGVE